MHTQKLFAPEHLKLTYAYFSLKIIFELDKQRMTWEKLDKN